MVAMVSGISCGLVRASDHGLEEGQINNRGSAPLYCFKDLPPEGTALCYLKILPGESCFADAVGWGVGKPVYKVPNYTQNDCTATDADTAPVCVPSDKYNALLMVMAHIKATVEGKPKKYSAMSWDYFHDLMQGGKHGDPLLLVECDKDWKSLTALYCPAQ